jgi:hypothetical protein
MRSFLFIIFLLQISFYNAQQFGYSVHLKAKATPLPGLHSYSIATKQNKWLFIGGRKDGIHPRQPFNAFPQNYNNDTLYLFDIQTNLCLKKGIQELPTSVKEQLQSTNANFFQSEDTLLILGGYSYAESAADHITHPYLLIIQVDSLIHHIETNQTIINDFKQISDQRFANTGGNLSKIGNTYYLIGGHRFDGRYNPMNNPTFTQTYFSGIQPFQLNNSGTLPVIGFGNVVNDEVHLRRRDYNLLSQQINGQHELLISSGVFQLTEDLPFLYPVSISQQNYTPHTAFNQYLSNYHSAKAMLYHVQNQTNYTIFFGGISQYFYQDGQLVQDNTVPFVKTISLLQNQQNNFQEFKFDEEMPSLKGSAAHFIPLNGLTMEFEQIILDELVGDSILIGYIFGGIESSSSSAFTDNQTNLTSADYNLYEVYLIPSSLALQEVKKPTKFQFNLFPNPTKGKITIEFELEKKAEIYFYLRDSQGKIVDEGLLTKCKKGKNSNTISIPDSVSNQLLQLTISRDYVDFDTKQFVLNR